MFKKRTLKRKPSSRREETSDDSEAEHDAADKTQAAAVAFDGDGVADNEGTFDRIQRTKRKRKLLTDMQYKRGVNAQDLLVAPHDGEYKVLERKRRAAGLKNIDSDNDQDNKSQLGLWESKHQQAMEEFIQQKLDSAASNSEIASAMKNDRQHQVQLDSSHLPADEQELYQQLAAKARQLAGKFDTEDNAKAEGDTGTGGAMLAGTGIAEVILPPTRVDSKQQLPRNALSNDKNGTHTLPTSWASHHAVPSRFAQPSIRTMDLPQEFVEQQQQQGTGAAFVDNNPTRSNTKAIVDATDTADANDDRIGFEAARRGATNVQRRTLPPKQQATDDQVYRKFVGHVREQQHKKK
ncbi:hypothetical protein MPSEU_000660000 [Mayamaea pseudoterrestris]|nr:hypothetical protein MPSEU_000660000 [Mayamaea pseudoterrestris]